MIFFLQYKIRPVHNVSKMIEYRWSVLLQIMFYIIVLMRPRPPPWEQSSLTACGRRTYFLRARRPHARKGGLDSELAAIYCSPYTFKEFRCWSERHEGATACYVDLSGLSFHL